MGTSISETWSKDESKIPPEEKMPGRRAGAKNQIWRDSAKDEKTVKYREDVRRQWEMHNALKTKGEGSRKIPQESQRQWRYCISYFRDRKENSNNLIFIWKDKGNLNKVCSLVSNRYYTKCQFPSLILYYNDKILYHWGRPGEGHIGFYCLITSCESIMILRKKVGKKK